ncbi:MAG: REDY-like protein HapK [Pseudomonadota bacterium]
MAQRILVLFNLKDGVTRERYEDWAKTKDIPGVRALKSVDTFDVYRNTGLLMGDGTPPYQYFEILDINDMDVFGQEASSEAMQAVAAEFQNELTKDLVFLTTEQL